MTQDRIIKLARESQKEKLTAAGGHWFQMEVNDLERFAALVRNEALEEAAEAYAQAKAADEARMQQAVMWISLLCEAAGLDPEGTTVEFSDRKGGLPPITVSVAGTITALQERLK